MDTQAASKASDSTYALLAQLAAAVTAGVMPVEEALRMMLKIGELRGQSIGMAEARRMLFGEKAA